MLSNRRSAVLRSRFISVVHRWPPLDAGDEVLVERLRELATSLSLRPVVLVTGDRALRFLSRTRAAWDDVIDHDLAAPDVVEACVDKATFAGVAERLGLPVPETLVPADCADMAGRSRDLKYPLFVKPVAREAWSRLPAGTVQAIRGQRVETANELLALCARLERHGPLQIVVQTFVPGADHEHLSVHAYVDSEGCLRGAFTGSKLRVHPPSAGLGAFVSSRRNPAAIEVAEDVLAKLGYTGFAILNFKRDTHSGEFRLLEINCRHSTWVELPSRCGCNFPVTAYAVITGQQPPPLRQVEGPSWLDFSRDLQSLRTYRRTAEWTVRSYLRSLATVRCCAFLALDDPGPFFHEIVHGGTG